VCAYSIFRVIKQDGPYKLITKPVLTMFFNYRKEGSSSSGSRTAFQPMGTNKAAEAQDHRSSPPKKFRMHGGMPSQSNTSSVHFAQFIWQRDNLAIYLYLTSYPDITQNFFSWSQQLNVRTVISLVHLYQI